MKGEKILIAESGSGFGGTAKYLTSLVPLLKKEDLSISVLAYGDGAFLKKIESSGGGFYYRPTWRFSWGSKKYENRIISIFLNFIKFITLVPRVAIWIKKNNFKIVHLNNEILSHLPLLLGAWLVGCKVICHFHMWRKLTRSEKFFAPLVSIFISISEVGAKYFEQQLGQNVIPITNGVVLGEKFSEMNAKRTVTREKLGLSEDDILYLLPGRLVEWKGQEIFLRALSKLSKKNKNVKGLILGRDDSDNHHYLHHLNDVCDSLNIREIVTIIDFQEDIWSYYAASDVVIHASTKPEPFGLVIVEGMYANRPVIATEGGGVSDIVVFDETGLLVSPGNVNELAAAMSRLLENPVFRKNMAESGKKRAEKMFSMESNAKKICDMYEKLCNKYYKTA